MTFCKLRKSYKRQKIFHIWYTGCFKQLIHCSLPPVENGFIKIFATVKMFLLSSFLPLRLQNLDSCQNQIPKTWRAQHTCTAHKLHGHRSHVIEPCMTHYHGMPYFCCVDLWSDSEASQLSDGATENAELDIARPSKLLGLTSRDWTMRHHSKGGHRET